MILAQDQYNHLIARLRGQADADHAAYPQYAYYWDGREWFPIVITMDITTKMGLAFQKGDVVLAKRYGSYSWPSTLAYSFRNKCNTPILGGFERIEMEVCGALDPDDFRGGTCALQPDHDGVHANDGNAWADEEVEV